MNQESTNKLLLMLVGIVSLLLIVNVGLFVRMSQMQSQVLRALQPFQRPSGLEVGTEAPDFRLTSTDGEELSLQDYSGQRVLLMFSSTTCPYCEEAYPAVKALQDEHPDIAVIMVSREEEDTTNQQLLDEEQFTFPILTWEDEVAQRYQVPGTPYFYLINGEGTITNVGSATTLDQLQSLVQEES